MNDLEVKDTNTQKTLKGHIDGVFHQSLSGWFLSEASESDMIVLEVNGIAMQSVRANLKRPDVEEYLGCSKNTGFVFDLSAVEKKTVVTLTVTHVDNGFDFDGIEVNYCSGISEKYHLIYELFYPEYYRCRYDCCHLSNEQAFQSFMQDGIFNDKDPNPWFSNSFYRNNYLSPSDKNEIPLLRYLANEDQCIEMPSDIFEPKFYRDKYSDLIGIQSLLWHYCKFGRFEGRTVVDRKLPSHIMNELDKIAEIEPLVSLAAPSLDNIVRYDQFNSATYFPRIVHERFGDQIQAVICVPFISRGGADLIATFLFRAYQQALGKDKVLLIVTDSGNLEVPEWIETGSQVVIMDEECTFTDDEKRLNALHTCLGKLAPQKIINVNSKMTWDLFRLYGVQLSKVADLYAYFFCFDYDEKRRKVGYITDYFSETIKYLKAAYFDNKKIISDIKKIYGLRNKDIKKLHAVYVPAAESITPVEYTNDDGRDTVLWVGRLSLQKRPDILVAIAALMPRQKFDVYGPMGNSEYSTAIVDGAFHNIRYCGTYNNLDEINYSKYKCFLNTSEWDGLPTIIIQMMAVGLPVVTSSVCGITELAKRDNSWLVSDFEDIEAYVEALSDVFVEYESVLEKIKAAKNDVSVKHKWNSFYNELESRNAFIDHETSNRENVAFKERRRAA